jgi:hypothetical protein
MYKMYWLFIVLFVACTNNDVNKKTNAGKLEANPKQAITKAYTLLKPGDLITRTDNDWVSISIRNLCDSDKTYSHCGMIFETNGKKEVWHIITGDENKSGLIQKESFESFVNPNKKSGFGVFRYNLAASEIDSARKIIETFVEQKIVFDNNFDIDSNDKLYCSEMLYKAIKQATGGRFELPRTIRKNYLPGDPRYKANTQKRVEYLATDNMFINKFTTEIMRVNYPALPSLEIKKSE